MERPESPHVEFLREKDKIDGLFDLGYQINSVTENLGGAYVEFVREKEGKIETKELHIINPDARKHFATRIINDQNSKVSS